MPIYEYLCQDCGAVFEVKQKFADPPLHSHPECGGAVKRLLSAPALQFKGSGWYITDYARGGANQAKNGSAEKSSDASAPAAKESSASADSKAATKA